MYNKYYKSRKTPTVLEKHIVRKVINIINENTVNFKDREYRRILGRIIKRIYFLRNLETTKKVSLTDFSSENNPSKKRRLSKTTIVVKNFTLNTD